MAFACSSGTTNVSAKCASEPTAAEKLSAGCFDVYLADPREAEPGGQGPPPRCRGCRT